MQLPQHSPNPDTTVRGAPLRAGGSRGCGRAACGGSSPACASPLVQSLDWETFEQYCTWQLFLAHSIPLETIIPILQHLKYKGEAALARQRPRLSPGGPELWR